MTDIQDSALKQVLGSKLTGVHDPGITMLVLDLHAKQSVILAPINKQTPDQRSWTKVPLVLLILVNNIYNSIVSKLSTKVWEQYENEAVHFVKNFEGQSSPGHQVFQK